MEEETTTNVKVTFDDYNTTYTSIPADCYVQTNDNIYTTDVKIYIDGELVTDVYGLIRYGTLPRITQKKRVLNWREFLGE